MSAAIWTLAITVVAGGWGPVMSTQHDYPNKESCYEALRNMRVTDNGQLAQGERGQNVIARCAPKAANK